MRIELNATHDPARRSWLASANDGKTDFPIQNLPFGLFSVGDSVPRGGVALGDRIIDLTVLIATGLTDGPALTAAQAATGPDLAALLTQPSAAVSALRARLSDLFREGGEGNGAVPDAMLVPQANALMHLPLRPTAFTDFCASIEHIRRMGAVTGAPPKLAWSALPVAYNGRASSVVVDGAPVIRPTGQYEIRPGSNEVVWAPERLLDFELEFGVWLRAGSVLGQPITVRHAEDLLFGCCLVNDWSARGIQFFESMLGPHLGKSFLTTISPWIVTMEALAPFRVPARGREPDEPNIPPYLADEQDRRHGAVRVSLTAELDTGRGSQRIVATEFEQMFWTLAQMVAHQASGGAPLEAGDLVASGTVSGATDSSRACLAEITQRGTSPIVFPDDTSRIMLEDGDTLTLRGRAHADGAVSIGFGRCSGTIAPAVPHPGVEGVS